LRREQPDSRIQPNRQFNGQIAGSREGVGHHETAVGQAEDIHPLHGGHDAESVARDFVPLLILSSGVLEVPRRRVLACEEAPSGQLSQHEVNRANHR